MATQQPKRPRQVTLNAYGAVCAQCGRWVHEENGEVIGKDPETNKWQVIHLRGLCELAEERDRAHINNKRARVTRTPDGDVPWEQQNHHDPDEDRDYDPARPTSPALPVVRGGIHLEYPFLAEKEFEGIPEGFYAVWFDQPGDSERIKCRLVRGATSGRLRFQETTGKHRILAAEISRIILEKIRANGVLQASKSYATATANCYRCNRKLTDPKSIELGIGPVCRGEQSPPIERRKKIKDQLDDGDISSTGWSDVEEANGGGDEDFVVADHESNPSDEDDDDE